MTKRKHGILHYARTVQFNWFFVLLVSLGCVVGILDFHRTAGCQECSFSRHRRKRCGYDRKGARNPIARIEVFESKGKSNGRGVAGDSKQNIYTP